MGELAFYPASPSDLIFWPRISGRYYGLGIDRQAAGDVSLSDEYYFIPFKVTEPGGESFDRIAVHISGTGSGTGGTAQVRLGIYNEASGTPGALRLDAGTILGTATGFSAITISQSLPRGRYFLSLRCNDSTLRVMQTFAAAAPVIRDQTGFKDGDFDTILPGTSIAYGTMADPAPALTFRHVRIPMIALRKT